MKRLLLLPLLLFPLLAPTCDNRDPNRPVPDITQPDPWGPNLTTTTVAPTTLPGETTTTSWITIPPTVVPTFVTSTTTPPPTTPPPTSIPPTMPTIPPTTNGTLPPGEVWLADWDCVANQMSGGDWAAVYQTRNPSSFLYGGGLMIPKITWDNPEFGGLEFASQPGQATKDEQIIVAQRIFRTYGPSPEWDC